MPYSNFGGTTFHLSQPNTNRHNLFNFVSINEVSRRFVDWHTYIWLQKRVYQIRKDRCINSRSSILPPFYPCERKHTGCSYTFENGMNHCPSFFTRGYEFSRSQNQSSLVSFCPFFSPIRFAPSLFLPSIFISHDREKDTGTDRRKHHRLENHGTSHTSFRPWYRDAEGNLWSLFVTGSLPMKNIDTFFATHFFFARRARQCQA